MFQTKICGVTSIDDALMIAAAGAGAIGLNFYPRSPRHVSVDRAAEIVRLLPPSIRRVGLFVNADVGEVVRVFDVLELDWIQLHGDEPPDYLGHLGDRPIIRAFRVGGTGLNPAIDYLERCRCRGCLPRLVLLDAYQAGQYGGTGQPADWGLVANYPSEEWHPPLVLAGGLTPENVAEAVARVRPAAVDTASGVETAPGIKSPDLVRRFVEGAETALRRGG